MTPEQTRQIIDFIAASDNRNVTEKTYGAWQLLLGHLDFEMARSATVMALTDDTIRWVEPKHILSKVSRLIDQREADKRRELALSEKPVERGAPMPKCKHDKGLLYCEPCCHQAAIDAGLIENKPYQRKNLADLLR